jgi:hypothetical protein
MYRRNNNSCSYIVALIIVASILVVVFGSIGCSAKAGGLGIPQRYDVFGGCMVQPADNQWVPLENYRYVGK